MCKVVRCFYIEDGKIIIKESFLDFFAISGKNVAEPTEEMLKQLNYGGWAYSCVTADDITKPKL